MTAATARDAAADDDRRRGQYAGFISRAVAFAVDAVAITLVWSGTVFVVDAVLGVLDLQGPRWDDLGRALAAVGTTLLVFFWYYTLFLTIFGKTAGMMLMGLRVVRADGRAPGIIRSMVRTAAMSLSSILLLGYLWVTIDNRRQGWHDKIARTFVVYDWAAEASTLRTAHFGEPLVPHG